jgi:hypothetical protein
MRGRAVGQNRRIPSACCSPRALPPLPCARCPAPATLPHRPAPLLDSLPCPTAGPGVPCRRSTQAASATTSGQSRSRRASPTRAWCACLVNALRHVPASWQAAGWQGRLQGCRGCLPPPGSSYLDDASALWPRGRSPSLPPPPAVLRQRPLELHRLRAPRHHLRFHAEGWALGLPRSAAACRRAGPCARPALSATWLHGLQPTQGLGNSWVHSLQLQLNARLASKLT